jgi:tyrosine-specific transport protein
MQGPDGLIEAKRLGQSAIIPLQKVLNLTWVNTFGQFFGFCALTTSFLGVTLGLKDFLADGLKLKKAKLDQFIAWFIVIVPPTCIVLINPNLFLGALSIAGGIGCALLLGVTPILMVWKGRFNKGHTFHNISILKSRLTFILLLAFVIFELYFEFFK